MSYRQFDLGDGYGIIINELAIEPLAQMHAVKSEPYNKDKTVHMKDYDYGTLRRIFLNGQTEDDFGKLKVNAIYVNEQKKTVVVVFNNGHKKIVKCSPKDEFDAEVGFALAIAREFVGEKMKVSEFVAKKAKVIKAAPVKKRKRRAKKPNTAEDVASKKRGRKPKAESQKEENK